MHRSGVDLGESLASVTFVVLDFETTGGSPKTCAITEVGAVKLRGGECLGKFQTLINPGVAIPPEITFLTGITEAMVIPAPRIEGVLPALLEFIAGAVIVGHNVAFDLRFLRAALTREGYSTIGNRAVDTCALARRLLRDEVPDCRLATLAAHFRTVRRPSHRALDDAEATGEVLHSLLERAGSLGVLALEDLVELPSVKHPQVAKLKLTNHLPRRPGVYVCRDASGGALYVGKAINLRRRVRSYFAGEDHDRKLGPLLRELAAVDHVICSTELEASVVAIRLINELSPRYNREVNKWRQYAYLKLTLNQRRPRLVVVRSPKSGDGCVYLGPLPSAGSARLIAEAIQRLVPLDVAVLGLTTDPDLLLAPMWGKMAAPGRGSTLRGGDGDRRRGPRPVGCSRPSEKARRPSRCRPSHRRGARRGRGSAARGAAGRRLARRRNTVRATRDGARPDGRVRSAASRRRRRGGLHRGVAGCQGRSAATARQRATRTPRGFCRVANPAYGRVSYTRTPASEDDDSLTGMVHAFVLIDAEPARISELAAELADVDGVAEVYSVAGEADLVAVVRVRRHEELAEVVTRRMSALPGITNTRTLIAFQAYSRHDLEAMWDLGAE
jgi:DNA polymerase III epsilon subunit family exonuclease